MSSGVNYNVFCLQGSPHTLSRDFGPQEFRGVIRQLVPGRTYVFKIQAETRVGFGPETAWKQKMPILAPPKPSVQVVPTEVCKSSTTIQIRFRKNYFSEANGPVSFIIELLSRKELSHLRTVKTNV